MIGIGVWAAMAVADASELIHGNGSEIKQKFVSSRAGGHTGFVHKSDIHSPTLLPLCESAQMCADVL